MKDIKFVIQAPKYRSTHPEVFLGKGVLKICSKYTGEHISIKLALRHGCSPVNLLHIFRAPFPKNISEWLLLKRRSQRWKWEAKIALHQNNKNLNKRTEILNKCRYCNKQGYISYDSEEESRFTFQSSPDVLRTKPLASLFWKHIRLIDVEISFENVSWKL